MSTEEMKQLIEPLNKEIEALKSRLSDIESKLPSGSSGGRRRRTRKNNRKHRGGAEDETEGGAEDETQDGAGADNENQTEGGAAGADDEVEGGADDQDGGARKKKKKRTARKLSGYMLFVKEQASKLTGMSVPERGKKMGAMWREMSDAEKAKYK